jgi:hypothetical protein
MANLDKLLCSNNKSLLLVNTLIANGATVTRDCFYQVVSRNDQRVIDVLKVHVDVNIGLEIACRLNNTSLVSYFSTATNKVEECINAAKRKNIESYVLLESYLSTEDKLKCAVYLRDTTKITANIAGTNKDKCMELATVLNYTEGVQLFLDAGCVNYDNCLIAAQNNSSPDAILMILNARS